MDKKDTLTRLVIGDAHELLAPFWDASVATLPTFRPGLLIPEQMSPLTAVEDAVTAGGDATGL